MNDITASAKPSTSSREQTHEQLLNLGSSTVYEGSGVECWLDSRIRPVWAGARLAGPAYTARVGLGDNLAIHRAIREAPSGSVLVVDARSGEYGHWGEVLTQIALARGLAGLVIDGTVRDADEIAQLGFPVFATGVCMRHAQKTDAGVIAVPVEVGGRTIGVGDLMVADTDGVIAVPAGLLTETLAQSAERHARERARIEAIRNGHIPPLPTDGHANTSWPERS